MGMRGYWRNHRFWIIYSILLAAFTTYALLDVFLIPHRYETVKSIKKINASSNSSVSSSSDNKTVSTKYNNNTKYNNSTDNNEEKKSKVDNKYKENTENKDNEDKDRKENKVSLKNDDNNANDSNSEYDVESVDEDSVEYNNINESNEDIENTDNIVYKDDYTYKDANIIISLTTYRKYDTDIYVADVKLSSADYLKTALAENTYGRNIKAYTSVIAEENNAILAINGDFYGAQSQGYVIRNGVLYRSSAVKGNEDLAIYDDGSFEIIEESKIRAEELLNAGTQQVLAFGPALVENGKISVSEKDEVGKAMASNPRTAIGLIDDLHYVFVVSDGRSSSSKGLSLYQLAQFMEGLGVKTAYNLDGGGSSTMYFNGRVINNPTTNGRTIKEREVSDIVYIGY